MFGSIPPVTRALILVNIALYVLERYTGSVLLELFALWPPGSALFEPWQLVTYAFLHDPANIWHIILNMFALYMFGRSLEVKWGGRRFIFFYLICVLTAGLTQLAVQAGGGAAEVVLGASGGVFGVLLAFGWYFPKERLLVLPIPVPIPAWLFVTLYALVELYLGFTGKQADVAHFAHLGGMLGAALCILYWRARQRFSS